MNQTARLGRLRGACAALATVSTTLALVTAPLAAQSSERPAGWQDSSHGRSTRPDYARVFPSDTVQDLRITIAARDFQRMQDDLAAVVPAGRGRRGGGPRGGGADFAGGGPAGAPPFGDPAGPRGRGRGGPPGLTTRDPVFVPVTVAYDGRTWSHVGMRYKGNSSLMGAASPGASGKLPFRLDFDQYEDTQPGTRDQRFFGFQKLTFSSNMGDDSQLREAFATEVLRDRGVPAARAAFYRVHVDIGTGPQYWGLYTMVEDPADGAMLDAQFGSRSGNLYKPDGPGATWTEFIASSFEKKTNEKAADFRDVENAVAALHASPSDAAAWRAGLESYFDVDLFLRWLAVNTALQNWDAYGAMSHNYYLYGDPERDGRLRWIPWDHNFSLGAGPGGGRGGPFPPGAMPPGGPRGMPPPGGAGRGAPGGRGNARMGPASMDDPLHRETSGDWPLIQRLLADPVYAQRYRALLEHALGGLFSPDRAEQRLSALHRLIAPAVSSERPTHTTVSSAEAFRQAVDGPNGLMAAIRRRHDTIRSALVPATQP